jgi:hypothetical protein
VHTVSRGASLRAEMRRNLLTSMASVTPAQLHERMVPVMLHGWQTLEKKGFGLVAVSQSDMGIRNGSIAYLVAHWSWLLFCLFHLLRFTL